MEVSPGWPRYQADLASAREHLRAVGIDDEVTERWLADSALSRPLTDLAAQVAAVFRALPKKPVRLATLAVDVCEDAHALDDSRPLGRAVARLAAAVNGLERLGRSGPAWRAAWASIGVLCNEVSSRVLVLNLPLYGTAPAVTLANASPGEPVWLTLRSLSGSWSMPPSPVYICENPTIVEAAADDLGRACPPLICTDGMASAAALNLIGGLAAGGCRVLARADFDRAGFVILDQVRSAAPPAQPWRFDAETYGLAGGDPDLFGPAGRPIHEEAILPILLRDLTQT